MTKYFLRHKHGGKKMERREVLYQIDILVFHLLKVDTTHGVRSSLTMRIIRVV